MTESVRRVLVVLGMHRSGTSALTRVLGVLGATLPADMLAANPDNPRGFWESRAVVHRHEALLREQSSFWHDILPVAEDWYATGEAARYEDLLVQDVLDDFGDAPLAVIKDPRMCRLMPLWERVFHRAGYVPTYIVTLRDAMEIAASLQRRNGFPLEKGLLLWLAHMLAAESGTRGKPRVFASYDDVLADWRGVVDRIGSGAGVEFDCAGHGAEVEAFLSADLRHSAPAGTDLAQFGQLGAWIACVTGELRRAAAHNGEPDHAVLDRVRNSFDEFLALLRPVEIHSRRTLAELAPRAAALKNEVKALREQVAAYQKETARLQGMEVRVAAMEATLSWRITAPLRWGKLQLWQARNRIRRHAGNAVSASLRFLRDIYRRVPVPADFKARIRSRLAQGAPRLFSLLQHGWSAWHDETYPALEQAFRIRLPGATGTARLIRISECPQPLVSIVIPVYNNLELTLSCLDAVCSHQFRGGFEVIVVDDGSADRTSEALPKIEGLKYVRHESNQGFVKSCNHGATLARGDYIVFLNNDTFVQPGWLAELVATAQAEKDAGLVGSQLLYPDGTLQEAGGIVWSDGNAWNYGRGLDRRRPEFNFLRDVDYCSGASILVPTALFRELGGFDEAYAPAYYEDTDLAFKIRQQGRRVIYQPLSRVVHFEGATSGTDPGSGVKRYQALNRDKFLQRWRDVLSGHAAGPAGDLLRTTRPRVLIIDSCTPMPDRDSGSVDAFQLMRILRNTGHDITFIAEDELRLQERYTADLQRMGVQCLYRPFIEDTLQHLKQAADQYDIVFLTRFAIAEHLLRTVRQTQPRARVAFIVVDLHFLRLARAAEVHGSEALKQEAAGVRVRELAVARDVDLTVVKSDAEMDMLRSDVPAAVLFKLPLIIDTPGVEETTFRARKDFVFVGGFRHPPNVDAVMSFVVHEWPRIRAQIPDARLRIIGSEAPEEILDIAVDGVDVVGYVEDLASCLNSCRVMVAPLRFGAGVKGKIGRALGYGLPCVGTPVAMEGMGLVTGRDAIVADLGVSFVSACVDLYLDEEVWARVSQAGRRFFQQHYSESAGRRAIADMLRALQPATGR